MFYWRQLHVVAEEVAEILVVFCRQKYSGVFEGEWFAVAKPCLREDFAFMIGARAPWTHQLSKKEAARITIANVFGEDCW